MFVPSERIAAWVVAGKTESNASSARVSRDTWTSQRIPSQWRLGLVPGRLGVKAHNNCEIPAAQ
jgi:hypothetical protein